MLIPSLKAVATAAALGLGLLLHPAAQAQGAAAFPSERVTIVVPFNAGGPFDTVARILAPVLQEKWRQPVIVENRPGAGTVIGSEYVSRARPDGHTLLLTGDVNPMRIFTKLNFDPLQDLKPVSKLIAQYFVVVATPAVPARTLGEFIAYARQRPKALNYAEIPLTQYQIEYPVFFEKTGLALTAVPYNGAAPITTALLANDVQFFFGSTQLLGPHIASGKLHALAVTAPRRIDEFPDVPTVREAGIDYDTSTWYGLYAPGRTPDDVVAKLAADFSQALHQPAVAAKLKPLGYEIFGTTPAQFAQELAATARSYDEVARRLNIRPQ